MTDFSFEHYKSLKEEHRQCLTQIQQLWLFKLSALGAVITFSVFGGKTIGSFQRETVAAIGLVVLPFVSMFIDLKVLEFSLHIKAISDHVTERYKNTEEIYAWEKKLWSGAGVRRIRTWITMGSAIGVTICILVVSFSFAYALQPDWGCWLMLTGIFLICIELIVAFIIGPKLLSPYPSTINAK